MNKKISAQLEEKFARDFEFLSSNLYHKNIGLAVSGGVDSIALLLLMHKLALEKNINLTIFTVNHNLRPEAFTEVNFVAAMCKKLQIKCVALSWDHQNDTRNLSARAREARYNLMTSACLELDILTLLTAHHADDSLETFLLKKERKSGVMALSSGHLHFHGNIRILRPLFDIHKRELESYVKEQGVSWMEDSSNQTDKYLRNIVRKNIALETQVYKNGLANELRQINQETIELNIELIHALAVSTKIYKYGFSVVDVDRFNLCNYEVCLRTISYILNIVSGSVKSCRASIVSCVISSIKNDEDLNRTMHGCVVKKVDRKLLIYRELGKKLPQNTLVRQKTMWDKRFCVVTNEQSEALYITNLTLTDYSQIKEELDLRYLKKLSINHHKAILFTLPVIKTLEKLVAIPHISYCKDIAYENIIDFSYQPSFMSRFIHFY